MDEKSKKNKKLGYFYITLFAILIIGGIVHKRVFDGPQFMMLWHLPAAVFLVLGGKKLTQFNRERFYRAKAEANESLAN